MSPCYCGHCEAMREERDNQEARDLAIARAAWDSGYHWDSPHEPTSDGFFRGIIAQVDETAAVSAPESALQAPAQAGGPQDADLGEHRLHAGKEAEPPHMEENEPWFSEEPCFTHREYRAGKIEAKRDEHARAVAILKVLQGPGCWCPTGHYFGPEYIHTETCKATRAYCEEE